MASQAWEGTAGAPFLPALQPFAAPLLTPALLLLLPEGAARQILLAGRRALARREHRSALGWSEAGPPVPGHAALHHQGPVSNPNLTYTMQQPPCLPDEHEASHHSGFQGQHRGIECDQICPAVRSTWAGSLSLRQPPPGWPGLPLTSACPFISVLSQFSWCSASTLLAKLQGARSMSWLGALTQ